MLGAFFIFVYRAAVKDRAVVKSRTAVQNRAFLRNRVDPSFGRGGRPLLGRSRFFGVYPLQRRARNRAGGLPCRRAEAEMDGPLDKQTANVYNT